MGIILLTVALALLLMGYLLLSWFGYWGERWGATPEEFAMPLTGNEWLKGRFPRASSHDQGNLGECAT